MNRDLLIALIAFVVGFLSLGLSGLALYVVIRLDRAMSRALASVMSPAVESKSDESSSIEDDVADGFRFPRRG